MPLSKKRRNQLWYGYVIGMVVVYALIFLVVMQLTSSTALGFLAGFISLIVSMIGFLILMRRLGGPPVRPGAGPR